MRYLPDSAILGTYGRMKHMGRKKRHSAKEYQATADFLNNMINKAIQKQLDKKRQHTESQES